MNDADKIKAKIRKILNLDDKVVFLLPDCLDGKRVEMTATDGVRYVAEQVDPNDYKDVLVKELSTLLTNSKREAVEETLKKVNNSLRANVDYLHHCYHYFGNDAEELLKEDKKMYAEGLKKVRKTMKNIASGKWQKRKADDYLKERGKE
jgi:homospermidine synthase